MFEANILKVDAEWREVYREAQIIPDLLKQEMFEPSTPWSVWSKTNDYIIKSRTSDRELLTLLVEADLRISIDDFAKLLNDLSIRDQWDENVEKIERIKDIWQELGVNSTFINYY